MRILHVITTIDRGGAEKQLLTLIREQVKDGKSITVVYLKGKGELIAEFEAAGSSVDSSLANDNIFFKFFKFVRLARRKFDLIHAHLPEAEILSTLNFTQIPIIVSRHNSEPFFSKNRHLSLLLANFVESRARRCIAISHAVESFLIESREWRDSARISVIHYGIECPNIAVKSFPQRENPVNFLTIGRLVPQKSIPTLLYSFSEHVTKFENDKLIIVGDGFLRSTFEQLARELNLSENVTWIGRVENVERFYRASDVFVLASKYEGFGLVLLEAMCHRVAILGSNISSIPEVLGPDHPGLFECDNTQDLSRLMQLSRKSDFREEIVSHQNERLKEFSPVSMCKKMNRVYSSIMEKC